MATPSEILIPVRRRHEDTRAQIETAVTQKQQWGYAEDEDLLFIRRKNKSRRYFSRTQLFRPNSAYQPSIIVDDTDIQINHNAYYNGGWSRYSANSSWMEEFGARWRVNYGATGPAGGAITQQTVLDVSDIFFWVNQGRSDSDFIVSSQNNQNSIYMMGDTGYIGLNKYPNAGWSTALETLIEYYDGATGLNEYAEFSTSSVHQSAINFYFDGVHDVRKANGNGLRVYYTSAIFGVSLDIVGGVAGSNMSWDSMFEIGPTYIKINSDLNDVDTIISTENNQFTLMVWGEKDNVGIHTQTPLDNVGTSDGDFAQYGNGLHIVAPTNNEMALLILEGEQVADGGTSPAAGVVLCDQGGASDDKMIHWFVGGGVSKFSSLADDQSASFNYNVTDILTMDLGTGYIGIGMVPSASGILAINFSTDDVVFKDADDSITTVGAQTAVIVVDVGSDTDLHIPCYVASA